MTQRELRKATRPQILRELARRRITTFSNGQPLARSSFYKGCLETTATLRQVLSERIRRKS